ncbi:MAG: hypothetical protein H7X92_13995 [Chitinophagales bacterium]|nr:hypothetical protein [Hyphomicrobiales bacterium]
MQLSLSSFKNIAQASGGDGKFDYLTVRDQIIDMGDRSISIPNIASITVFQRKASWLLKGFLAIVALYFAYSGFTSLGSIILAVPQFVLAAGSIALLVWLFRSKWFLSISTSDGILSLFPSQDVTFLRGVKAALDEKINGTSTQSTFTFNFTKDPVEKMNIARGDTIHELQAESDISEPPPMVATVLPSAPTLPGSAVSETLVANTAAITFVDYERFIPGVEQFRNYLAEKRPNPVMEAKLDEMLELMRQGTGEEEQKVRLRDLAGELTQYVQAYQPLRDLFSSIVTAVSLTL